MNANFVNIKTSYGTCGSFFSLKSQLHKHLKDGCTALVKYLLLDIFAFFSTLLIFIVTSQSVVEAMGPGLAFWG